MEQDNNNNTNNNTNNTETVTLCQALAQLLHPPRTAPAAPVIEKALPLPAEVEKGNCEYKYTLAEVSEQHLAHRVSQLLWRLKESVSQQTLSSASATFDCNGTGNNNINSNANANTNATACVVSAADQCAGRESAHYHIGVDDDGSPRGLTERELRLSLQTLQEMAGRTRCEVSLTRVLRGTQGLVAHVTFRRTPHVTLTQAQVCCVALAGDANSGKSSLIGVLSSQERDNGRGSARLRVIAHNHELTSGRTSSVTHTALHFSAEGTILSNAHSGLGNNNYTPWLGESEEMAKKTKKLVSLVDLAGHERYLKTTLSGLFGRRPDTVCLTVSLAAGVTAMTREHLAVALALNVPIAIAVTKIDLAKERVRQSAVVTNDAKNENGKSSCENLPAVQTIFETLRTLLSRQPRAQGETARETVLWPIQEETQLDLFLTERESMRETVEEKEIEKVPVFFLSSVTGEGLPLLQRFFFHVHPLSLSDTENEKTIAESETECHIRILGAIGRGESWAEDGEDGGDGDDDADFDWEDFAEPETKNCNKSKKRRKSISLSSPSAVNEFADFVANPPSPSRDSMNTANVNSSPSQLPFSSREDGLPAKILIGKVMRGRLAVGDELMLGPSTQGDFLRVCVTSVRVHNLPVQFAAPGHVATFCLARAPQPMPIAPSSPSPSSSSSSLSSTSVVESTATGEKTEEKATSKAAFSSPSPPSPSQPFASPVRRRRVAGLALLSSHANSHIPSSPVPTAAWEFLGEVLVVTSSLSPLRVNYQPVLHCGALQQAVRLLSIEKLSSSLTKQENERVGEECAEELKSEERALCKFRFVHYPEFLCVGDSFILREDRIKAVGKIVRVTAAAKS